MPNCSASSNHSFAHVAPVAALTALAGSLESALAYFWLTGKAPGLVALGSHLALAGALTFWANRAIKQSDDIRLPLFAALSIGALGPLGAAGVLLTLALTARYMRHAVPFEEWYNSLFPDTREAENRKVVNQIAETRSGDPAAITAFSDVLSFGSFEQKQDLIALISRHFRPAFGPVLKRALNDEHSAIRVQAATAMSKLENAILEQTIKLRGRFRSRPDDTEALRALAQHYDECLFCGILDTKREEELLGEALSLYQECLVRDPGDLAARLAAGRLLLRTKRYREAAEQLCELSDRDAGNPQATLWYMESLFRLGQFEEIHRLARFWASQPQSGDYPPETLDAVRLWAESQEDEVSIPVRGL